MSYFSIAQKIDLSLYENKAQAYAILSSQYSQDAYFLSKQNFFSDTLELIKKNCSEAIVATEKSIVYADSAILYSTDTNEYARNLMSETKKYQELAIEKFRVILSETNKSKIRELSQETMYANGNAIVDAYNASLYFAYAGDRGVTRSESDEFSFMTACDIYDDRLKEIDEALKKLEEEAKSATGERQEEINNEISSLEAEKEELLVKKKNCKDKLFDIRNGVHKALLYKVQVGLYVSSTPPKDLEEILHVRVERDSIYYRYVFGNFQKYEEAKIAKDALRAKGYKGSFVLGYIYGKKVNIREALQKEEELSDSRNSY